MTAVATEQEMIARVSEMRARVVEAEAQIPMAMADAFRKGHLVANPSGPMKPTTPKADTGGGDPA